MTPRAVRHGSRALALGAAALTVGAVVALSDDAGPPAPAPAPAPLDDAVAAGRSFALTSSAGPIRVWVPAGYHPDGAAVVLYVHGYYTDVERAWIEHRLPEQFALASVNAVFIAAAAPAGARPPVTWPHLDELLAEVFGAIDVVRPTGELVAVGHSGAYRTLLAWAEHPGLDWIIHLDATYGEVDTWLDWLAASPRRRLIFIGDDTVRWTEELADGIAARWPGELAIVERFGDAPLPVGSPLEPREPIRAWYLRSQWGHMALATDGRAIPTVLRLAPIEVLADGPWREPLGLPARDAGVDGAAP
ncbi:MAG: hypothetical protein KBG48_01390 [Kofleriaceae bacterium]|nr:hypothetical protein [Kofleriaceae bacterium]MBP9165999.1 hypothetical protein [Kofleriaceae bacterium]MBP9857322.1 hypothetical protein [Kofleriaceae bacterium]